jgi:hypothetical protein
MNLLKNIQGVYFIAVVIILLLLHNILSAVSYPVFFITPEQFKFIISGKTPFQN